jgi:hypothetical protein
MNAIKEKLDYSKISDIEIADIDYSDAPDFCDAYICEASYNGEPMTPEQLEEINYDKDFVYDQVIKWIY